MKNYYRLLLATAGVLLVVGITWAASTIGAGITTDNLILNPGGNITFGDATTQDTAAAGATMPSKATDNDVTDIDGSQGGSQAVMSFGDPAQGFKLLRNETVYDPATQLYWASPVCSDSFGCANADNTLKYNNAVTFCTNLIFDADGDAIDETDWRLPTITELLKLAIDSQSLGFLPAVSFSAGILFDAADHWFPYMGTGKFWSSTVNTDLGFSGETFRFTLNNIAFHGRSLTPTVNAEIQESIPPGGEQAFGTICVR